MSANNSIIVQLRRGNTAQTSIFTGALAEITVDTDKKTLVVHDGVTQGGFSLSSESFQQSSYNQANTGTILAQAAFDASNNISSNTLTSGTQTVTLNNSGVITLPASSALYNNTSTLSTNTANQVIDTFSTTTYRTAKYLIQAINGADVHSTELLVTHNDVDTFSTEYAVLQSGSSLFDIYSGINTANVEIKVSPINADTTIDFVRISMTS
jgi:hypothetical protein